MVWRMPKKNAPKSTRGPGVWTGKLSAFGRFLKTHKLTRDAVATGLEITPSYVSMIAHGKASPGFKLAGAIAAWTRANAPAAFELADWE